MKYNNKPSFSITASFTSTEKTSTI